MAVAPHVVVAHRPRGRARPVVFLVVLGAILCATLAFAVVIDAGLSRRGARLALTPDAALVGLEAPPFTLADQEGRPVTRDALLGRVTLLDFFFTSCPFVCPMMSRNMLDAQKALAGSGVRLLSVSVDPEHDTPERMREYAKSLGADTTTWTFVSGDIETVRRISEGGFTLGLSEDATRQVKLPDGTTMQNVAHSSKFVLVGPDGRALALCNGTDAGEVAQLIDRARRAAKALAERSR